MRLQGKTAIVTGAASGQGLATVRALVGEGANVVAADIDEAGLDRLAKENVQVSTQRCDMSKPADVKRLVATAEETFGAVHAYSASKGAVLMLTKSVAVEYAKDNIRANCLCPGGVRTPMVDAGYTAV